MQTKVPPGGHTAALGPTEIPKARVTPTQAVSMGTGLALRSSNRDSALRTFQSNPLTATVFRACPSRINEEPDQKIGEDA